MIQIPVIFEDENLVVIDKPSGIVVNKAETVKTVTVADWMQITYPRLFDTVKTEDNREFLDRSGIVHRLDKETSGLLVIAKTPVAFAAVKAQFMAHAVRKEYLSLVHNWVVSRTGDINAPIGRLPWNREQFGVVAGGKEAQTGFEVKDYYRDREGQKYSLLLVLPKTGRTHQIRVHMKYINNPLVGDYSYAGRKQSKSDRDWSGRVMLHAYRIRFLHPASGETLDLTSPLPPDFADVLSRLVRVEPAAGEV